MAVIITDMDMPRCCFECPLSSARRMDDFYCDVDLKAVDMGASIRREECPLKSTAEMIAEIEDYNVRQNFEGTSEAFMLGVARGLDLSAEIAHKYCNKESQDEM